MSITGYMQDDTEPGRETATGEAILDCANCRIPLVSLLERQNSGPPLPDEIPNVFQAKCPRCSVMTFKKRFARDMRVSFQAIPPFILLSADFDQDFVMKFTLKERG